MQKQNFETIVKYASAQGLLPAGRHNHSAVLHDSALWVYGGMTGLQENQDFFMLDLGQLVAFKIVC